MALALAVFIVINFFASGKPVVAGVSSGLLWLSYSLPVFSSPRPADLITALRLALALTAFVLASNAIISPFAGLMLFIFALALDGLDGWLARRTGPTAFGALFDQESDNVFLAALWLSAFSLGQELMLGLGLVIPFYRIALVGLRHYNLVAEANPVPPRLLGLPRAKLLFVAVAGLSLLSYALAAAAAPLAALIAAAGAVACSTLSFWPDFFSHKT